MPADWNVYMLRCHDGSLYTGITTDVARRLHEHNTDNALAAHYTRTRRPLVLVYQEKCTTRSAASKREYAIKHLSCEAKQALIAAGKNV